MESVLEDTAGDLGDDPSPEELRTAYGELSASAAHVLEVRIEPSAVGGS